MTEARERVLEVNDLVAGYLPGVHILNGCSITVDQGDLIGIIGPNGAGKSTLLKSIFGQVNIRGGSVMLNGEDITGLKADRLVAKGVGMVPQNNNVFPSLTIEENLQMGVFQQPKTFNERFEFVGALFPELVKRRRQRAGSLSGGERQMVAMGRALMMDPAVLLLDEPSAGLSPVRQDESFLRIAEINHHGVTIVMVEQNARRCLQIASRAYVLDQGKDAYTGTGRELMNDPKVIQLYLGTLATDVEEKARTASHAVVVDETVTPVDDEVREETLDDAEVAAERVVVVDETELPNGDVVVEETVVPADTVVDETTEPAADEIVVEQIDISDESNPDAPGRR